MCIIACSISRRLIEYFQGRDKIEIQRTTGGKNDQAFVPCIDPRDHLCGPCQRPGHAAAPLDQLQSGITVPVAGGCGDGWHRGPGGGCRRNGHYGGVYYGGGPVVVAPGQSWLSRRHVAAAVRTAFATPTVAGASATEQKPQSSDPFSGARPPHKAAEFFDS